MRIEDYFGLITIDSDVAHSIAMVPISHDLWPWHWPRAQSGWRRNWRLLC